MISGTFSLYAPTSFVEASPDRIKEVCNGCGAKDTGWMVPDTLWGLSVTEACNVHDWMYQEGKTLEDKDEADRVFLNNMVRSIRERTTCKLLLKPRLRRAKLYYEVVRDFGGPAFWSGKNDPKTEVLAVISSR